MYGFVFVCVLGFVFDWKRIVKPRSIDRDSVNWACDSGMISGSGGCVVDVD